jgi:hypothetical protein
MSNSSPLQRAGRVWIALVAILALVLLVVILGAAQRSRKMSSDAASSSAQQFSKIAPGTKTKLVIEVQDMAASGTISGTLLNQQTEQVYDRTATTVNIKAGPGTRYVMGKPADLRRSAVIHVTGTLDADRHVDAEQIVILTGYVQVR